MKNKAWPIAGRFFAATFILAFTALSPAADFPELKQKIDSTAKPLGVGSCETRRTGVWLVDGGVVVEIQKPKARCLFETLELVVDGEKIKLTAVDNTFYYGRIFVYGNPVMAYQWYRGESGKLFFRTERTIDPSKIQGILEPDCGTQHCLNEESALKAKIYSAGSLSAGNTVMNSGSEKSSAADLNSVIQQGLAIQGRTLREGGAQKLSVDEIKTIIRQGVAVETYAPSTGSIRLWTNDAAGKFIASRRGGSNNAKSQGTGEWALNDSGEYCVKIEWRTSKNAPDNTEEWCRALYRHDGALYLAPSDLTGKEDAKYSVARFK